MSGLKPFFITGARAKIRVNGKTLAFCTDLSYSVAVATQTPKILGMYEGTSVEPLGYTVNGSFTIIRYAKDAVSSLGGSKAPHGVTPNDSGNGIGNWGSAWGGGLSGFLNSNGIGGHDGRPNENLDPSKLGNGTTFDIEVYQTTKNNDPGSDIGVAKIRNVRITQADFAVSKKSAATQRFTFTALYVDEDSFVADFSGIGQHNT